MPLAQQRDRRHDLTRRAVAALERVVRDERLLHRVQHAVVGGQPLDRGDLTALAGDRERQTGQHPPAIHPDRAGPTGALVTALLGSGQPEVLAQRVEQADPGLQFQLAHAAVDGQRDRAGLGPAFQPPRYNVDTHCNLPLIAAVPGPQIVPARSAKAHERVVNTALAAQSPGPAAGPWCS
jgi:hypothetical protein